MDYTAEALFDAILLGHAERLTLLLDSNPALIAAHDAMGDSAVIRSVILDLPRPFNPSAHRRQSVTNLLVQAGGVISVFESSAVGDFGRTENYVSESPDLVNEYSPGGWTLLHLALISGNYDMCLRLMELGSDIEAISQNRYGATPLQLAVMLNKLETVSLLLAHGGDPNAGGGPFCPPLFIAVLSEAVDIVELLLSYRAETACTCRGSLRLIDIVTKTGNADLIRLVGAQN